MVEVSIPFSTPGANESRTQVEALERAISALERATNVMAGKMGAAAPQVRTVGDEAKVAGEKIKDGMDKANQGTEKAKSGFDKLHESVRTFGRIMTGLMIANKIGEIGESLLTYGARVEAFTKKVENARKEAAQAEGNVAFKREGSRFGVQFGLQAAGISGDKAGQISLDAAGLTGAFKPGEQFGFLQGLTDKARRGGMKADDIETIAKTGLSGFAEYGALPGFAESFTTLATAKGRRAPRDAEESQDLIRQAAALSVRRGGVSEDQEKALVGGIGSGDISVSRSGQLSTLNTELKALTDTINKAGGLGFQEAKGVGSYSFKDRFGSIIDRGRGGRVGEATPDEIEGFQVGRTTYGEGLKARTKEDARGLYARSSKVGSLGVTPEFRDMTKKEEEAAGGGKPQLLETRQWLELGAVAVTTGIALVGFRTSIIAATAALGRLTGLGVAGTAATGAAGVGTAAAGTGAAAAARTVAIRVAAPLAALALLGTKGDENGTSPEYIAEQKRKKAGLEGFTESPEFASIKQDPKKNWIQRVMTGPSAPGEYDKAKSEYDARMLKALEAIEKNTAKAADAPKLSQPSAQ